MTNDAALKTATAEAEAKARAMADEYIRRADAPGRSEIDFHAGRFARAVISTAEIEATGVMPEEAAQMLAETEKFCADHFAQAEAAGTDEAHRLAVAAMDRRQEQFLQQMARRPLEAWLRCIDKLATLMADAPLSDAPDTRQ